MQSTLVKVIVGVLGIVVLGMVVSDGWKKAKMSAAGKKSAHASCVAGGQDAATCTAFVKSRHDACWKMSFRPSMSTKYSRGPAAHLDQPVYDDCILRGPEIVAAEAAKAREALRKNAAERGAVLR